MFWLDFIAGLVKIKEYLDFLWQREDKLKSLCLGVPWRYPGRGKAKRRKALQRLRFRDFPRLPKAAQKRF